MQQKVVVCKPRGEPSLELDCIGIPNLGISASITVRK
jgi:hypothetical protein